MHSCIMARLFQHKYCNERLHLMHKYLCKFKKQREVTLAVPLLFSQNKSSKWVEIVFPNNNVTFLAKKYVYSIEITHTLPPVSLFVAF